MAKEGVSERGKKSAKTRMLRKTELLALAQGIAETDSLPEANTMGRKILALFEKPSSETFIVVTEGKKVQYSGPFRNRDLKEKLEWFHGLFKNRDGAKVTTVPATEESRRVAAELMVGRITPAVKK